MSEPLRVLLVEDSEDDAQLLLREMRRAGFAPRWERVETGEALSAALSAETWDLLVSDYSLPSFSGLDALKVVQERRLDLPFIIVSGAINEETAVAAMRSGAHDYVLKDNLVRLGPAIARELREAKLRHERRRVEQELAELKERSAVELRRSRDELDIILSGVAEGVIAEDASRKVIYVNETAARANGYSTTDEMLRAIAAGAYVAPEIFDEAGRLVSPAALPASVALATGAVSEKVLRTRDIGTGEERWNLVTSTPIFDDRRQAWMAITIFRNITERKRSEAAVRFLADASAALSSSLDFASTAETIARLGAPRLADWCFVEVAGRDPTDRARLVISRADAADDGLARDIQAWSQAARRPLWASTAPLAHAAELHSEISENALRAQAQDAQHLALLQRLAPKSAVLVPLAVGDRVFGTVTLLATAPGRRYSAPDAALAEEIGRRASFALENARLYRQAQDAIAARDEFLSIASHELRTPLTALTLQLQSLQRMARVQPVDAAAMPANIKVDQTVRQAHRLGDLVDRLFDVSRVATGHLTLQLEAFDLSEMVRRVGEQLAAEANDAECTVHLKAGAAVMGVWDRLRLEQVITNLLANAFKYGPSRPVEIEVTGGPSAARVTVKDHGIGIAPQDVTRIFGRFERAVSSRHYGGLGLGLFIARQIIEAHGGTISAVSEPGVGSTFSIDLPLRPSAALEESSSEVARDAAGAAATS